MEIISIIGAVASVIAAIVVIYDSRYSKVNILRIIDRKNDRIQAIDNEQVRLYGLNRRSGGPMSKLDMEKGKLQDEIKELSRYL